MASPQGDDHGGDHAANSGKGGVSMKSGGLTLLALAIFGVFSLMESEPGTPLYFICVGSVSVFLGACYGSILRLEKRVEELEARRE